MRLSAALGFSLHIEEGRKAMPQHLVLLWGKKSVYDRVPGMLQLLNNEGSEYGLYGSGAKPLDPTTLPLSAARLLFAVQAEPLPDGGYLPLSDTVDVFGAFHHLLGDIGLAFRTLCFVFPRSPDTPAAPSLDWDNLLKQLADEKDNHDDDTRG